MKSKKIAWRAWLVLVTALAGCSSNGTGEIEPVAASADAILLASQSTVASSISFSCALVEGGGVKCWGENVSVSSA